MHVVIVHMVVMVPARWVVRLRRQLRALARTDVGIRARVWQRAGRGRMLLLWLLNHIVHLLLLLLL